MSSSRWYRRTHEKDQRAETTGLTAVQAGVRSGRSGLDAPDDSRNCRRWRRLILLLVRPNTYMIRCQGRLVGSSKRAGANASHLATEDGSLAVWSVCIKLPFGAFSSDGRMPCPWDVIDRQRGCFRWYKQRSPGRSNASGQECLTAHECDRKNLLEGEGRSGQKARQKMDRRVQSMLVVIRSVCCCVGSIP